MGKRPCHDLPISGDQWPTLLVEPRVDSYKSALIKGDLDRNLSDEIYRSVVDFNFRHVGRISYVPHDECPVYEFIPCGGKICNTRVVRTSLLDRFANNLLTCSNCNIQIGLNRLFSSLEIEIMLWHLMQKNLSPSCPSCNFLDCGNSEDTLIKTFGTVSLLISHAQDTSLLWGLSPEGMTCCHWTLAFTLGCGFDTRIGIPAALVDWNAFLQKKREELQNQWLKRARLFLNGPMRVE